MTETHFIILNNQRISAADISILINERKPDQDVPEWEKELYLFIHEWFSESKFILTQTSGSTGEPKPIELPKSVMQKSAERTIAYLGLQKGDRLLLSLPCQYIAGKMMVVRAIVGQMNLITAEPSGNFDFLEHESYQLGALVPNQVFKILEQSSGKEKLQNIRNLLIGGSAISATLEKQISSFSNRVVLTYGMTETASHIAIRELSGTRKSETYNCLPGISVSLNQADCLQVKLPEFNEPLQTNDLAEIISDSSFRILGRVDSVIISGGIKFSPEAIELKIQPLVAQRIIISSLPDEKLGAKLVLIIEGNSFETRVLKRQIQAHTESYERPKEILFVEKFPETNNGKIMRNELKQIIQK